MERQQRAQQQASFQHRADELQQELAELSARPGGGKAGGDQGGGDEASALLLARQQAETGRAALAEERARVAELLAAAATLHGTLEASERQLALTKVRAAVMGAVEKGRWQGCVD